MSNKKKSPYNDYLNCQIFEGDIIQHPSGEKGTVVFEQRSESDSDNWLVQYEDGIKSRLCLQVGDKGQAYVVKASYLEQIDGIVHKQVKEALKNFEPQLSILESKDDLLAFAYNNDYDACVGYRKLSELIVEELGVVDDHIEEINNFESLWLKLKVEVEQAIADAKQNLE